MLWVMQKNQVGAAGFGESCPARELRLGTPHAPLRAKVGYPIHHVKTPSYKLGKSSGICISPNDPPRRHRLLAGGEAYSR